MTQPMDKITFQNIVRIIVLKPTTELDIVFDQEKYKHIFSFPILYGIILGFSKTINKTGVANFSDLTVTSIGPIISSILITLIACFVYSWVIYFISKSLKGEASIDMTYGLVSYSLIPMIIGVIFYLMLKLFTYSYGPGYSINIFIFYSQIIFVLWSTIILTLGNAFINGFSMIRSLAATSWYFILFILSIIFAK
jgi:hypothetical protein